MISGACHCGAVAFELMESPQWLTSCNCSICRRIAALWAHSEVAKVRLKMAAGATLAYHWGDGDIEFHSCRTCGCTTHWAGRSAAHVHRLAVNCRMAPPEQIAQLPVRHFDGAETWTYLD